MLLSSFFTVLFFLELFLLSLSFLLFLDSLRSGSPLLTITYKSFFSETLVYYFYINGVLLGVKSCSSFFLRLLNFIFLTCNFTFFWALELRFLTNLIIINFLTLCYTLFTILVNILNTFIFC